MARWIPGTRDDNGIHGVLVRPEGGDPRRDAFYAIWPYDATASEVADALVGLANALRKDGDACMRRAASLARD